MGSLVRPIAGRAMHLHIAPRPSNLGESREIMRLMSQFGDIEYYKNLKYEETSQPRSAILIYKETEAANECLRRSPIRFRMGKATARQPEERVQTEDPLDKPSPADANSEASIPRGPTGSPFGLGTQTRSMSTSHNQLPKPPRNNLRSYMPFESPPETPAFTESRIFEVRVHPTNRNLRDHVNHGHYHSRFAVDTKMVGQGDLAKKVPTPGLSCINWKAVETPAHVTKMLKERDSNGVTPRKRLGLLYEEGANQKQDGSPQDVPSQTTHISPKRSEFGII